MPRTIPKSQRQYVKNSPAVRMAATLSGAKAGPFPKFIAPALATLRDRPPSERRLSVWNASRPSALSEQHGNFRGEAGRSGT